MPSVEIIFNVIVALAFIVYWSVAFIILYHLTRFGIGVQPKRFAAIFLLGSVILFCLSFFSYLKIDTESLIKFFQ